MENPTVKLEYKDCIVEDRRLWIGNLDPRVTDCNDFYLHILFFPYWYQLLKLVQKHGAIEKFDLIFHRNGPLAGLPRGYAFVTYTKKQEAISAKEALNNLLVGQKVITVTWAHIVNNDEIEKPKEEIFIPALAMSKSGNKTDPVIQIQAIEAKLKMMEKKQEDELKINDTVATKTPVIVQYQHKINSNSNLNSIANRRKKRDRYYKPYAKNRHGR